MKPEEKAKFKLASQNVIPYFNIGPGPFIKEELKARGWRREDLAEIMGISLKLLDKLIKNKYAIDVRAARLLSKAFGQSSQFWLTLDTNYRVRLKNKEDRNVN